jgi:CRISPR-associated protein Csx3
MAIRYPAIFVGGPPHSGKSWLVWNVSTVLRRRGVKHYVLRAHPDGEGHWRHEAPPAAADELRRRVKQQWTPAFAKAMCADIERRHLPLLVDTGGMPSEETRLILSCCTAAVLLASEPSRLEPWRDLAAGQAVPLLADLGSTLDGPQRIDGDGATLRGIINGLGPERDPAGVCFDALVARMDLLCRFPPAVLFRSHAALIDIEPLNLEAQIGGLPAHQMPDAPWTPAELPGLLASLAPGEPLALYGAAPPWLSGALAVYSAPATIKLFHVALGWVEPPPLARDAEPDAQRLAIERPPVAGMTWLRIGIPGSYLDYDECCTRPLPVPSIDAAQGVVLDGRLPIWLYAALCRAYSGARWLAIREPRTDAPRAVVIASHDASKPIGTLVELPALNDATSPGDC